MLWGSVVREMHSEGEGKSYKLCFSHTSCLPPTCSKKIWEQGEEAGKHNYCFMQALGSSEPCPRRVNLSSSAARSRSTAHVQPSPLEIPALSGLQKNKAARNPNSLPSNPLPLYPPFTQLLGWAGAQELQHTSERLPAEEASSFHTHITPQCGNSGNNTRKGFLITVPVCSGQFMQSHKGHGGCAKKHKR